METNLAKEPDMASFDASPFGLVSEWLTLILSRHHFKRFGR